MAEEKHWDEFLPNVQRMLTELESGPNETNVPQDKIDLMDRIVSAHTLGDLKEVFTSDTLTQEGLDITDVYDALNQQLNPVISFLSGDLHRIRRKTDDFVERLGHARPIKLSVDFI